MSEIDTCGKTVSLISICFFGYSKKYTVLRAQGQIITPTKTKMLDGYGLPLFIEMILSEGLGVVE